MKELGADADRLKGGLRLPSIRARHAGQKAQDYLASDPRFVGLQRARVGDRPDPQGLPGPMPARSVDGQGSDYDGPHRRRLHTRPQARFVGIINFQEETAKAMTKIRRLLTMS